MARAERSRLALLGYSRLWRQRSADRFDVAVQPGVRSGLEDWVAHSFTRIRIEVPDQPAAVHDDDAAVEEAVAEHETDLRVREGAEVEELVERREVAQLDPVRAQGPDRALVHVDPFEQALIVQARGERSSPGDIERDLEAAYRAVGLDNEGFVDQEG